MVRMQWTRAMAARRRQAAPELERGDRTERTQARERHAPADQVGQHAAHQAAGHAARGIARDDQPDGLAQRLGVHLLGQPRRRHRRQAGQAQAQQRAQRDQRGVVRGHRAQQAAQGAQHDGGQHHRLRAEALGQEAGGNQSDGHRAGRRRQHAAGLRRTQVERAAEQRQQRLRAVEHREHREAADEQGPLGRAVRGAAGFQRRRQRGGGIGMPWRGRHRQAGGSRGHGAILRIHS